MLQQSSFCESLFFASNLGFRPRFGSAKATISFTLSSMDNSLSNSQQRKLLHSSSSSHQNQRSFNPVLACRALSQSQDTSPENDDDIDKPIHGLSETIVGVLGGGQLGRMLCQAASKMAIKVMVLDPQEDCPASALAYNHMIGSFDDSFTVKEFAKRCGVLTVEIEHVDVETLETLEKQGVDCQPKASTIRIIQDKYLQKVHFSRHDIPLPEFMQVFFFLDLIE